MDEKRLSSYRSIIHPIISIIIPFLLFWTMQSILATAIGSFSKIPRLFPLLLLAAGMAEAGVSNYLYKEKVGEF
jgi:L-lactate permease